MSGNTQPCWPQLTLPHVWGSAGGRLLWKGLAGTPASGPPAGCPGPELLCPAACKQGLSPAVMNGGADGTALGGCKATGQTVGPGSPSWGHHPAGGCGAEPRAPVPMGTIRTAVAAPCPQACLSAEHQWTSCWGRGHPPGPHPEAPAATPAEGAPRPSRQSTRTAAGRHSQGPLPSVCIHILSAWSRASRFQQIDPLTCLPTEDTPHSPPALDLSAAASCKPCQQNLNRLRTVESK